MAEFVFDASAILAIAFKEPGAEIAVARMPAACVSAVNYSEAYAKMIDKGFGAVEAHSWLEALRLEVLGFAKPDAASAARLRETAVWRRISFADRACISLAAREGATAVTTDRIWSKLDLPCPVELIR
ncbi:MAG: type II toxin-antitoxin system VapC family toxin [Rhizobiaceae bacterium]